MLVKDNDGHHILDYLGSEVMDTLKERDGTSDLVRKAFEFVITESLKHQREKNSKLGFRYTLLRNYFEARLPALGFELKSE